LIVAGSAVFVVPVGVGRGNAAAVNARPAPPEAYFKLPAAAKPIPKISIAIVFFLFFII